MKRRSGPKSRTSIYLGVTQYKRTGRWEAHIWESSESRNSKGRQLHLGSFPAAEPAALAYDRAAQKLRPWNSHLNFPDTDYSQDAFIRKYGHLEKHEFVQRLRNWAQSSELADEFDGAAAVPRMSMPVSERKPVVSPIGTRLPSSKRARKRRHSSAPSMHYPRQEPAYQMQRASSYCENGEAADKEQGIPQHILELHALAMGKQPADFLKPALTLTPAARFTGTQSTSYNTQVNLGPKYLQGGAFVDLQAYPGMSHCGPPSSPLPRQKQVELAPKQADYWHPAVC